MLAYKPKEEPLLIKIAKSGMFQFLMVVLLGIGVTTFVIRTDQPQQWIQKINRFASVNPNTSKLAKTEAGIAEDQAEFEAPPPQANTWAARAASPTEMAAMTADSGAGSGSAATTTNAATGTTSSPQSVSGTSKFLIRMVEIDHNYIDSLTTEKNGTVNIISGNMKTFKSYPGITIDKAYYKVLKTDILEFNKDKKNLFLTAGNNSRGFRLSFQLVDEAQTGSFRFLDAVFTKNHPNDALQFSFELFLRFDEKFIISGSDLISYFEVENDLANVAPFQIFKSAEYLNQKTTFAIIIELQ